MKKPSRLIASIVYIVSIVMTLVVAFVFSELSWLIILLVAVQMVAYIWYTISLFPGGTKICKKFCKFCI